MAVLTITKNTIAELEAAPQLTALLDEYAAECAIDGLPHPKAKMEMYRELERLGALYTIGAWLGDELIGFVTILAPTLPHYGVCVAANESFFVAAAHRSTGAGDKLLDAAEARALDVGSPGLLATGPEGGVLVKVLPRRGYKKTGAVFFKRLTRA